MKQFQFKYLKFQFLNLSPQEASLETQKNTVMIEGQMTLTEVRAM